MSYDYLSAAASQNYLAKWVGKATSVTVLLSNRMRLQLGSHHTAILGTGAHYIRYEMPPLGHTKDYRLHPVLTRIHHHMVSSRKRDNVFSWALFDAVERNVICPQYLRHNYTVFMTK
jgi:hypothetical protein